MTATSPRIPGVTPADATQEQKQLMGKWSDMNFARVMARSPDLYRAFVPLIKKVVADTNLPPRDRQVLCLRTLTLGNDVYEVTHHEFISQTVGLSQDEVKAMRAGEGEKLTSWDKLLIRVSEQLVRDQFVEDELWHAMAERYSPQQLMEVVVLVGAYLTMAMVTRNFEMPLEDQKTFQGFKEAREYT